MHITPSELTKTFQVLTKKKQIGNPNFVSMPIYAITHDCKVIEFPTTRKALEKTGISEFSLANCVYDDTKTAYGMVFKRARHIMDELGNIDMTKVKNFANRIKAFCVIDPKLNIYSFGSKKEAIEKLGLTHAQFEGICSRKGLDPKDRIIVRRSLIENEVGELDIEKAQKMQKERFQKQKTKGFYVIDENHRAHLCFNLAGFAQKINKTRSAASACAKGKPKTIGGYALVSRAQIEDGTGHIDKAKLESVIQDRFYERNRFSAVGNNKVVAISRDGEIRFFSSIKEAAKALNKSINAVSVKITKRSKRTNSDWHFVEAKHFFDKDGKVDIERIKQLRSQMFNR